MTPYVDIHGRLSTHLGELQRAADAIPVMIWARSAAGDFVVASRAFQSFIGLSIENMRRRDMRAFGHPEKLAGNDYARWVLRELLEPVVSVTSVWHADRSAYAEVIYAAVPVLRPAVGGYGGHVAVAYPLEEAVLITERERIFRYLLDLDAARPPQRASARREAEVISLTERRTMKERMTMPKILSALALLLLTGCALEIPPRALLVSPAGQVVDCTAMSEVNTPAASFPNYGSAGRAMGAGMADGFVSAVREQECVRSYAAVGFRPLAPMQAAATTGYPHPCPPGWVRDARNVCDKPAAPVVEMALPTPAPAP